MESKVLTVFAALAAVLAVTAGSIVAPRNPAIGEPWRWVPLNPSYRPGEIIYPELPENETDNSLPSKVQHRVGDAKPYIVGGQEAVKAAYPWQVALFIDDAYFCGGALISDKYVLTAGHCLKGRKSATIVAGAHNLQEEEEEQVTVVSEKLIVHDKFSLNSLNDDIALIEMDPPMTLGYGISAIALPARSSTPLAPAEWVTVNGWGKTGDLAQMSPILMSVTVPILQHKKCEAYFGSQIITDDIVCTDGSSRKGVCNGDSGGALTHIEQDPEHPLFRRWVTRGIVSFGSAEGCEAGRPNAYTNVDKYLDWIQEKTGLPINE